MSIIDEFTKSFGKEFHTREKHRTNVPENCFVEHLPITKQWSFLLTGRKMLKSKINIK